MPNPEPNLLDDVWQKLLDKDDRTSPAEYPDMALVTREEVASIIVAAARPAQATEGLREALKPFADFCAIAEQFVEDRAKDGGAPILPSSHFRLSHFRAARDAYAALAPSKIAPSETDPQRKHSQTINLTDEEMDALEALAKEQELPRWRVLLQALRLYQLHAHPIDLGPMLDPALASTPAPKIAPMVSEAQIDAALNAEDGFSLYRHDRERIRAILMAGERGAGPDRASSVSATATPAALEPLSQAGGQEPVAWMAWRSGRCPVSPEVLVEIKWRGDDADETDRGPASNFNWRWNGKERPEPGDILAWRPLSHPAETRSGQSEKSAKAELDKIAARLGEAADPFAAWESLELILSALAFYANQDAYRSLTNDDADALLGKISHSGMSGDFNANSRPGYSLPIILAEKGDRARAALERSGQSIAAPTEPAEMALLRGPLSRRATSVEFTEWQAREIVAYVDRLLASIAAPSRAAVTNAMADLLRPRPVEEYHEDMGNVLWWHYPVQEPPMVGTTNDEGFDGEWHQWWTPLPDPSGNLTAAAIRILSGEDARNGQ